MGVFAPAIEGAGETGGEIASVEKAPDFHGTVRYAHAPVASDLVVNDEDVAEEYDNRL